MQTARESVSEICKLAELYNYLAFEVIGCEESMDAETPKAIIERIEAVAGVFEPKFLSLDVVAVYTKKGSDGAFFFMKDTSGYYWLDGIIGADSGVKGSLNYFSGNDNPIEDIDAYIGEIVEMGGYEFNHLVTSQLWLNLRKYGELDIEGVKFFMNRGPEDDVTAEPINGRDIVVTIANANGLWYQIHAKDIIQHVDYVKRLASLSD